MSITRRRVLAISAVAAAGAGISYAHKSSRWAGVALGADVSIDIAGADEVQTRPALMAALDTIGRMERLFSLYDPQSTLSRLNRDGSVVPEPEFSRLMALVDEAHALTGGLFDATVQPLFQARQRGGIPTADDYAKVGWRFVDRRDGVISYRKPGMAMTLNGIAQGFATDRVTEVLASHGFTRSIVNIGEYRVGDRLAALGIGGAEGVRLGAEELRNAAIATSVPGGHRFADRSSHILHPALSSAQPQWASVSVIAETAAIADALSTALVLAKGTGLAERLRLGPAKTIVLEGLTGKVLRI